MLKRSAPHILSKKNIIPELFLMCSFLIITIFNYLGLAIIFVLFLLSVLLKKKIYLLTEDYHIIFLFYLQILISFAVISTSSALIYDADYLEFYPRIFGRIINTIVFFTIFLFIIDEKNRKNISNQKLFNSYLIGCCILLFFGVWQILNMLFNVPIPNFNTRSFIHSTDTSALLPFLRMRVTSIAEEPAYLVPYLIDAIIILFYVSKKYLPIILFIVVLFFTLSLSAYTNLALILTAMLFFTKNTKTNIAVKSFVVIFFIYVIYSLKDVFFAVMQRLTNINELLLSGRLQEMIIPLKYMIFDAPFYSKLFGFGPKGFDYVRGFLTYHSGYRAGENIAITSHFIFIDFFIEHGIIGVLCIVLLFYYLFMLAKKVYHITRNRLAQVLWFHLFITSFYTSDYASPRFTVIMLLLLCLYKDAKNKLSDNIMNFKMERKKDFGG